MIAYFRYCELNESTQFLGVCQFFAKAVFEKKLEHLFAAMGWNAGELVTVHCYEGAVVDRFPPV